MMSDSPQGSFLVKMSSGALQASESKHLPTPCVTHGVFLMACLLFVLGFFNSVSVQSFVLGYTGSRKG